MPRGAIQLSNAFSCHDSGRPMVAIQMDSGRTRNRIAATNATARRSSDARSSRVSCPGITMNRTASSTTVSELLKLRIRSRSTSRALPITRPISVTASRPASCCTRLVTQNTAGTSTTNKGPLRCGGTHPQRYSLATSQPPPAPTDTGGSERGQHP